MTNKERIIKLSRHFDPIEVAEMSHISAGYVYRVLREHHPKTLTTQNYLEAIQMGITNKEELAQLFGVSRMTINRFERNNITKEGYSVNIQLVVCQCHRYFVTLQRTPD